MPIERYVHHGKEVAVDSELKGKHRTHCLCFVCDKFDPESPNHCPIAKKVFDTCVEFNLVTPVYECPDFVMSP